MFFLGSPKGKELQSHQQYLPNYCIISFTFPLFIPPSNLQGNGTLLWCSAHISIMVFSFECGDDSTNINAWVESLIFLLPRTSRCFLGTELEWFQVQSLTSCRTHSSRSCYAEQLRLVNQKILLPNLASLPWSLLARLGDARQQMFIFLILFILYNFFFS